MTKSLPALTSLFQSPRNFYKDYNLLTCYPNQPVKAKSGAANDKSNPKSKCQSLDFEL